MKINKAKSAGFCVGVKRAINLALKTAESKEKVYMLGDIVHNEEVVLRIKKAGIKKIDRLGYGNDKILLIRAHGVGLKTIAEAAKRGYKIVDATCPMVKEIHRIAQRLESQGFKIIVIGEKKHDEVQGIVGRLKGKPIVISHINEVSSKRFKNISKAAVVVQSTQNTQRVLEIVEKLRTLITELEFFDTICKPTKIKQKEAKELPLHNDVVIVVGSKNSANTKRLFEISKKSNPRTYWIGRKEELKRQWFKDAKTIGVTAGASTPDSTIDDIIRHLSALGHML